MNTDFMLGLNNKQENVRVNRELTAKEKLEKMQELALLAKEAAECGRDATKIAEEIWSDD